jgi:hypothetical protein
MNDLEELYYLLGKLEGLGSKNTIELEELDFINHIIKNNKYLQCNLNLKSDAPVNSDYKVDSYLDDLEYEPEPDLYSGDIDYDRPAFAIGDPRFDASENPWIDVFGEGEEAETAYWNTH